jgi:hypothetical protein
MTSLSDGDRRMLEILDERLGTFAEDAARAVHNRSNLKTGTALARARLASLSERGMARLMDDRTPLCWLRTPAGTRALAEAGESAHAE